MSNVANPSRPMNEGSDKGQDKNAASMAAAVTEKANEAGTFLADKANEAGKYVADVFKAGAGLAADPVGHDRALVVNADLAREEDHVSYPNRTADRCLGQKTRGCPVFPFFG